MSRNRSNTFAQVDPITFFERNPRVMDRKTQTFVSANPCWLSGSLSPAYKVYNQPHGHPVRGMFGQRQLLYERPK